MCCAGLVQAANLSMKAVPHPNLTSVFFCSISRAAALENATVQGLVPKQYEQHKDRALFTTKFNSATSIFGVYFVPTEPLHCIML